MKKAAVEYIEKNAELFTDVSHKIWEFAELSLLENKSAELYCDVLEKGGFKVEKGLCGVKTAFSGSYGSGRPIIAILGEFDALSGLSQKAALAEKEEIVKGGNGHGCGHNMLGAGSLAAAFALKDYLEKSGNKGTVVFYGCPGEEGGAGKAFMAREGLWKNVDAALTWHPSDVNEVMTGTNNSCIQVLYKFSGVASHAAGDPEHGRSALDAVELMNIGVQFLREHMSSNARIHYSIIDGGGVSPNVVQPTASVLYMVRSTKVSEAVELAKRVDKIADGAALMTETSYEKVFIDGTANTVPNHTLEKLLWDNMNALGVPSYTEEEIAYAAELKKTYPKNSLPSMAANYDPAIKAHVIALSENGEKALNDFLVPQYSGYAFEAGSTDVGDVSWLTPTAHFYAVGFASGAPGHSWQNVSCGASKIGDKAVIYSGKVLACAAIDLFENGEILKAAKAEFDIAAADGYTCPIPQGEKPKAIEF